VQTVVLFFFFKGSWANLYQLYTASVVTKCHALTLWSPPKLRSSPAPFRSKLFHPWQDKSTALPIHLLYAHVFIHSLLSLALPLCRCKRHSSTTRLVDLPFSAHHSANSKSCSSLIWHPRGKKIIIDPAFSNTYTTSRPKRTCTWTREHQRQWLADN
jgi:hypothetical protein